jgi:DNA-binding helix-hairpin-helix protein with protein kinase domain
MQLRRRSNGAPALLGPVLGRGGEGSVFPIRGSPDLVAKIYAKAPTAAKVEKLLAMALVRSPALLRVAAWPVDLLEDEKRVVRGFLMPKVTSREDVHQLYSPKSRRSAFPEADFRFIVRGAANIARAFAVVHAQGHVIGDVNHGNALIGRDGTVMLIDCDSFQIRGGGKIFTCDVGVPLFTPPELQGRVFRGLRRTTNHDAFGLAVLVFHLLFLGRHPYAGRHEKGDMPIEQAIAEARFAYGAASGSLGVSAPPGTLPLNAFGPRIAELFERAFESPRASDRPSATDWIDGLTALESELAPCATSRFHFHPRGAACCWCEIETRTRMQTFGPQTSFTDLVSGPLLRELWHSIVSVGRPAPSTSLLKAFPGMKTLLVRPAPRGRRARRKIPNHAAHELRRVARLANWSVGFVGFVMFLGEPNRYIALVLLAVVAVECLRIPRLGRLVRSLFRSTKQRVERELLLAEHRWRHVLERWESECSGADFENLLKELEAAKEELSELPKAREERLKDIEAARFWKQRNRFLEGFRIADETFVHLSAAEVARLAMQSVTTAADVRRVALILHQLAGAEAARELLGWCSGLEKTFRFNPAEPPDADDAAKLAMAERVLQTRQQRLLARLREGPQALLRKKQQIASARDKLFGPASDAYNSLRAARRKAGLPEVASD